MFHLRDGLYFERLEDGGVRIVKTATGQFGDAKNVFEIEVSAGEWASVVAAVSPKGETSETYHSALNFQNGN
jgi:hypothetical protein